MFDTFCIVWLFIMLIIIYHNSDPQKEFKQNVWAGWLLLAKSANTFQTFIMLVYNDRYNSTPVRLINFFNEYPIGDF